MKEIIEHLLRKLDPDTRKSDICDITYLRAIPRIECADGFSMSVQAGEGIYCAPRDNSGYWYEVEVGFPSAVEPLLMDWIENPDTPTDTVYPYVPIEIVALVIKQHGGFKDESLVLDLTVPIRLENS